MAPTPNFLMITRAMTNGARCSCKMCVSSLSTDVTSAGNLAKTRDRIVAPLTGPWTHVVSSVLVSATL